MRRLALILLLVGSLFVTGQTVTAEPAVLVADDLSVDGRDRLVASGNVEVLFGNTRLRASRIAYDRKTGGLTIEGPITLTEGGTFILVADSAKLDRELQNGILTSARAILDEQLQIAANQVRRVDGRYTEFTQSIASSCEVCASRPVPLWSIRARRVIHDQERQQLYFHNATFRVVDIPILYLPRLRLPDPTLRRSTGFLLPDFRSSSLLGLGVKIPFFIRMGDSRDLTLRPYISARSRTLEARYRQAFRNGSIEFNLAGSNDDVRPGQSRGYVFGSGNFRLPNDFRLDFDLELTSDPAYLLDYGYSDKDRLDSAVSLWRVSRDRSFGATLIGFRTLRDSEIPIADQLPFLIAQIRAERRFGNVLGGEAQLAYSLQAHQRDSTADILGRDLARFGIEAQWQRDWVLPMGIVAGAVARLDADSYAITQDSGFAPSTSRITPTVAASLRWPMQRVERGGAVQLLEPVMQIAFSRTYGGAVPNEDSAMVEFDEGNLLALHRFPGHDRAEQGGRAALGLRWTRYAPGGLSMGVVVGRVIRDTAPTDFTATSGLSGQQSDWLGALRLTLDDRLSLTSRAVFGTGSGLAKSDTRLQWTGDKVTLGASYVSLIADAAEGRATATREVSLDGSYNISRNWTGSGDLRFDFETNRAASAGLGLAYRNECITIDLYLSRRFTSSTSVIPTTNLGLQVSLGGFGTDNRAYRRACSQ